ncbi:MAG: plasmid maintenance system killer [Anaerolinea sp.]|nr:plasmid maintenance system killer [Anaerolinea sp.]
MGFADRSLERRFVVAREGTRAWGAGVARAYIRRLNAIALARNWDELHSLPGLRLHPLHGRRSGQWAISLTGRWRVVVEPDGDGMMVIEVTNHYGD